MSNKQIENLTVRLLQALDKNYDVVNMDAVLSIIGALENTKITKEQLEATRLAKYINLFRRRTKIEQLAKRAKSLLKRWREMVGMQQRPLGSCNDLMRNESATSSIFQENINFIEGITHTQQQNPDISFTPVTRNAFSNNSTSEKIAEYKNTGKMTVKTAPTSFSNVLAGFSGIPIDRNNPPFTNVNVANGPSVRQRNCNLKRNSDASAFPDAFSYEQQSNLNSLTNYTPIGSDSTKLSAITDPIIIDIEDSNSGSNLVEVAPPYVKESEVVIVDSNKELINETKQNKHKKTKKDKKRTRERDSFQALSTPLVVIDAESSLSQQSNLRKRATPVSVEKGLTLITDEKTRSDNLMVTNISEILSLSNSSMSSVFPTSSVGATKNLFSQQSNRPLSESDLSFAGKFAQGSGPALNTMTPTATTVSTSENKNNLFSYVNIPVDIKTSSTAVSSTASIFQPFTGTATATGCNSNDSASNSRHSTLEILDFNSQGNKPQQKRLESDLSFSTHRPKLASNKDVVVTERQISPMCETIQPQENLNIATKVPTTQVPEQKVPKKRGRKKGSKGIDSLIAKDTNLSSQMLIQSLGNGAKKVKTTKELYAEMQNRKLGVSTPTTPSQWAPGTQSQTFVRRDSFCSEPSLHSPRTFDACSINATVSTIATSSTPEKNSLQRLTVDIDSGSDSFISGGQSHESVALVSTSEKADNLQKPSSKVVLTRLSKSQCMSKMESQLRELVEKLSEVPSKEKIEMDTAHDTLPCTCKIIEIAPKPADHESEVTSVGNLLSLDALQTSNANVLKNDSDEPIITINVSNRDVDDSKPSMNSGIAKKPVIKNESKKSIFDLDFEDDEDPLQTLIAEVAAASSVSRTEEEIVSYEAGTSPKDISTFEHTETNKDQEREKEQYEKGSHEQQLPSHETPLPPPAFPTYKVEEDEACLAKQRFELQVQNITNFHIHALHNFYVPNVNGNWDNTTGKQNVKIVGEDWCTERLLKDGSNVVPNFCSFDRDEYIKKDLRNIDFDRNFKPKSRPKAVEKLFYETPFLGVARCLKMLKKSSHRKTRKHRQNLELQKTVNLNLEVNKTMSMDDIKQINDIVEEEPNLLLSNSSFGAENNRCGNIINNPSLNLVFDEITINVDKTLPPIIKENSPTESQSLLAIAANVNFNNNQIENTIGENETTEKICGTKFEENILNVDSNALDERITFDSDNGDIRNNNNCNDKDKSEDSSCESHSSLKQNQKSINIKLRNHRRKVIEQGQNSSKSYSKRKRRRKKSSSRGNRQRVKCIKIAINGGIATQRHIKMDNISDDNDEDDEYESISYISDLGGTDQNDSDTENESSENCEVDKSFEWKRSKDAAVSDREYLDDEEDYEYDDDEVEDDEFSGEFHEVVTRDISRSSESGNNHIVLTIKKTPSKTNSPNSGSLPPISPIVSGNKLLPVDTDVGGKTDVQSEEIKKSQTVEEDILIDEEKNPKDIASEITSKGTRTDTSSTAIKRSEMMAYTNLLRKFKLKPIFLQRKRRMLGRKTRDCKPFRFPDELKNKNDTGHIFKKQHEKLFFPYEIFEETANGCKSRIFEMSSCDSSCAELTEYEYESLSEKDNSKSDKRNDMVDENNIIHKKVSSSNSSSSEEDSSSEESTMTRHSNEAVAESSRVDNENQKQTLDNEIKSESDQQASLATMETNEVLPEDNGLLVSFNNICIPSSALEVSSDSVAKIKECDEICSKDISNSENYGHGVMADTITNKAVAVNSKNKSEFKPPLEYRTELSAIDVDVTGEEGNNCSRLQQFREWHQLLQLKSYNDELLTVLPYVVLD